MEYYPLLANIYYLRQERVRKRRKTIGALVAKGATSAKSSYEQIKYRLDFSNEALRANIFLILTMIILTYPTRG